MRLPQLPLDALQRQLPTLPDPAASSSPANSSNLVGAASLAATSATSAACAPVPVVVTYRKRVGWCNAAATAAGIRIGMSDTNAWSLSAALRVHARDLALEQSVLQEAALWTLHFTPQVVLQAPATPSLSVAGASYGVLAEVGASLRLFGGLPALQARLARGIAGLGLQAAWAAAPTATGAWLLAHGAPLTPLDATRVRLVSQLGAGTSVDAQLDTLPLQVLEAAQVHLATLTGIGCTTLGALRRLPRAGLARRFGKALLQEVDRAYGNQPQAHRWFEAPESIDLTLELPYRVDNTATLLVAGQRLLLLLTGWLTARHTAVLAITLWLHHEPARRRDHSGSLSTCAASTPVSIVLAAPSRDAEHLGLLLRERLALVQLTAPVVEVALVVDRSASLAGANTELFPTVASDSDGIGRLVERLQSRLGAQAVQRLATSADHRPERSHASCALQAGGAAPGVRGRRTGATAAASATGTGAQSPLTVAAAAVNAANAANAANLPPPTMRPGWLLAQPLALLTRQHRPFYQSALTLLAGPDRIESGWWDDALALRDYFIAENDRHVLLWVFRLRPDAHGTDEGWFLHGFFA